MSWELIQNNLFSASILFFFLGLFARAIRSDLEIPPNISKFLSLYLLMSIGLKGGIELSHSEFNQEIITALLLSIFMASIVPVYSFFILRMKFDIYNAGAIAATYGSISAVTFITAVSFLESIDIQYGGYMVAAMALMESPAIIIGVFMIRFFNKDGTNGSISHVFKEALTNGSVVLILGALVIGVLINDNQADKVHFFTDDLFSGLLMFFLLDMGLLAGKRLKSFKQAGIFALVFSILMPLINAAIIILLCSIFDISKGNSFLLAILGASASYIAVPAAMRMAVPQANASVYVSMSLAITFPFNIIFCIMNL